MTIPKRSAQLALLLAAIPATALVVDHAFPPNLARMDANATSILDRHGALLAMRPAPGGIWRFRTTPDQVSPDFLDLLVRTEDRRFWSHPGIDPLALARATAQMLRAGHVVSGGSTLAMQAARLLEPRPRTLRSKLIEAARALQLEWHYGKQGVLGIWLTLAPFGGNLEGVQAGARAWFGTSAALLDPAQAALLVALPRRPEGIRPDRHPMAAETLRDRVLPEAAGLPIPTARQSFPHHAGPALAGLHGEIVRTALDLALQDGLERMVAAYLQGQPDHLSMAVLVADSATREIRAIVSGDGLASRAGAMDLSRAIRSPGSALKPFLYALAFQAGLARPDSVLVDLPQQFGGYAPENFSGGHDGAVTAAIALRRSLNLPAVALLERVGALRFAAWLRSAGARIRLPPGADPSLPLALGGAGLTMRDLAGLYAGLIAPGAEPLSLLPTPSRIVPPPSESARLVTQILTQSFPDRGPPGIAWKTGTSWGGRDAWAFGIDRRHVVGVWVGRPDGTPVPGATGRTRAIPVLAQIFATLPSHPLEPPPPIPLAKTTSDSGLRLLFPPEGAVLAGDGPVTLRAMGGRRPLTFLIDGAPVAAEAARRQVGWTPSGPGFYRVTILDADGAAVRATVRVK